MNSFIANSALLSTHSPFPPRASPGQAIKPDGVQRQLVGEVITRFEKKGYKLVAMKV